MYYLGYFQKQQVLKATSGTILDCTGVPTMIYLRRLISPCNIVQYMFHSTGSVYENVIMSYAQKSCQIRYDRIDNSRATAPLSSPSPPHDSKNLA